MRIPRPPPPAAALTMTGYPIESARVCASSTPESGPSLPGTTGAPACLAISRAWALSPMRRMASGDGPMKVMPHARQISAKAEFSASRP